MITDEQDLDNGALGSGSLPSWEEIEEFIQAVNEIVGAISEVMESFSSIFIPSIRAMSLVFLRIALARRLCSMWNNRAWRWLSWHVAMHIPIIFLTRLLPVRFLAAGLYQNSVEEEESDQ